MPKDMKGINTLGMTESARLGKYTPVSAHKVKKPNVVIIGVGHENELMKKIIKANLDLGCHVTILDPTSRIETPERTLENLKKLASVCPTKVFTKQGSKYHK